MAGAAAQLELLEALAETPPRAFFQRAPSGQSLLRELYQQAAEADLAAMSAPDDIARLHALFDVALDHGLGGLVRDYLAEVCSDRLLTSSDPVEAFLLDAECVRRWVQKLLAVSRGRLAAWLARGLAAAAPSGGGGAGMMAKELGRLQMLQLIAEALAHQPGAAPAAASGDGAGGNAAAGGGGAAPAEPAELAEARRLAACAGVLSWLGQAGSGFDRPAGRFFSEQEWRSVAAKRREAAAAAGVGSLFLADLAAELARQGIAEAALAYPPPTPDRLLSALFLAPPASGSAGASASAAAGGTATGKPAGSKAAGTKAAGAADVTTAAAATAGQDARLALLAYYLADGGFLAPGAIVQGLQVHCGVPVTTASSWLMQQLLDDSHTGDAAGLQSLHRAAALVPAVDGAALPHKALQVFAARGRLDAALSLLRQRPESTVRLDEASVVLSVRLQNGLLGEAFMGLRQHLAAVAAAAPPAAAAELQQRHAQLLLGQLLRFAAATKPSVVHAVARLPFGGVEEQAVVSWLEAQAAGGRAEAALMLPLFFLLRGRTPEALHAYSRLCPRAPASQQQQELAALLAEAARMLPAQQRALAVQRGAAPALLPAGVGGGGDEGAAVALMAGVAAVAADMAPALLSVGPTASQAPLVGSVPALLEQQRLSTAAAAGSRAAPAAAQPAGRQQEAPAAQPMLFGPTATGRSGAAPAPPAAAPAFGAAGLAAAEEAVQEVAPASGAAGPASGHEFDRLLGLAAAPRAGGKSKRRFGGSAYR